MTIPMPALSPTYGGGHPRSGSVVGDRFSGDAHRRDRNRQGHHGSRASRREGVVRGDPGSLTEEVPVNPIARLSGEGGSAPAPGGCAPKALKPTEARLRGSRACAEGPLRNRQEPETSLRLAWPGPPGEDGGVDLACARWLRPARPQLIPPTSKRLKWARRRCETLQPVAAAVETLARVQSPAHT